MKRLIKTDPAAASLLKIVSEIQEQLALVNESEKDDFVNNFPRQIMPIVTEGIAEVFNTAVQEHIDSRLFLVCYYEPSPNPIFSSDMGYLAAIQDLYKFAFDSSFQIKQLEYLYEKIFGVNELYSEDKEEYEKRGIVGLDLYVFKEHIHTLQMLRDIISHTQSEYNGTLQRERIREYHIWVESLIGKETPEEESDYDILLQELVRLRESLLDQLIRFIAEIATLSDSSKKSYISGWIDKTIEWYCSGVKREIYIGHLIDYYIRIRYADNLYEVPPSNILKEIAYGWIKDIGIKRGYKPYYPKEMRERFFNDLKKELKDIIENDTLAVNSLLPEELLDAHIYEYGVFTEENCPEVNI